MQDASEKGFHMTERVLLLLGLLSIWADLTAVHRLRDLLLDFLIGAKNRKNAPAIHDAQSYDDRLTMNYIGRMIKRHQREFRFWLRVYHGFSLALLPKYAALITLAVVFDGGAPFRIALCIAAGLGIAFLILVRMQFDSSHVSKYAQR